jgi:hypothetical protein
MDYMLQPGSFTVRVGSVGSESSISLQSTGEVLHLAQGALSPLAAAGNTVNREATGLGPMLGSKYAVVGGTSSRGFTRVKLASFGNVEVCTEFGGVCDDDIPLVASSLPGHFYAPNATGSGGEGKGATGIVVIKIR